MTAGRKRLVSLHLRLPADSKAIIQEAAAMVGRSVSNFAVVTLVEAARSVLGQEGVTELTNRDRDRFIAVIE